ncbi:PKD domain-containing protein [Aquisphaera insulae]|uniref:PKD domain-containing protein n=1 Tax=Aquisphaera insulae TaxID=2712864 RepID=UPI0013EA9AC3|nr:PKD domain-containing protein [Aquisphaera insulae]
MAVFLVTNTGDAGAGSLRQAITDANSSGGADTIDFSIGSGLQTISPLSSLPALTDTVTIDGTTQPGFVGTPLIRIDGSSAGGSNGLVLGVGSDGSTVRGLGIANFSADAIVLASGSNVVEGNWIGINATGTSAAGNAVGIFATSSSNVIGGTTAAQRNVISGNTYGVYLSSASSNSLLGNYIGTDAAGTSAVANGYGVYLTNSALNTIGGATAADANVISGNASGGVFFDDSGFINWLQNNLVGVKADQSADLVNSGTAVVISAGDIVRVAGTFTGDVSVLGFLDLRGNSVTINGGLFGSGTVANNGTSTPATLTINGNGTFDGNIQDGGSATTALTIGGGSQVLTGTNTYSGGTTISAGTLQVGNGGSTGSLGSGPVVDNGTLIYDFFNGINVSNPISGSGTLNLSSTNGSITQSAGVTVANVIAGASSGIDLSGGGNSITSFSASNTSSGAIRLTNSSATLSIIGVTQAGSVAGSDMTVIQTGALSIDGAVATTAAANGGISLGSTGAMTVNSSIIAGGAGSVTLTANLAGTTPGNFTGILANVPGAIIESTAGNVSFQGTGGDTGDHNAGVMIGAGALVRITGGTGKITLDGTGGLSSGRGNFGVYVTDAGTSLTTGGGNIVLTGTGRGIGSSDYSNGVNLNNGAQVSAGGSGTITVQGVGGGGSGGYNSGIYMIDASTLLSTNGGDISITGDGGIPGDEGITLDSGIISASGSHSVTLTSTVAASGRIYVGASVSSGSGAINITSARDIDVSNLSTTGTLTTSSAIGTSVVAAVGTFHASNTTSGAISLTNTSTTLTITGIDQSGTAGGSDVTIDQTGSLSVTAAISTTAAANGAISLTSTAGMTFTGAVTAGGSGDLSVIANQAGVTSGTFDGVFINGPTLQSGTGSVLVRGTAGSSAVGGRGVIVQGGGRVITTGGTGTVTIQGTGGTATNAGQEGVVISGSGFVVTSGGGDVSIIGTAGGFGASAANIGVVVNTGVLVTAGGTGKVTVQGTGGGVNTNNNWGIQVLGTVTSSGGDVIVTGVGGGAGGGASNAGVIVNNLITAGGTGTVNVTGTGNGGNGVLVTGTGTVMSNAGDVSITALVSGLVVNPGTAVIAPGAHSVSLTASNGVISIQGTVSSSSGAINATTSNGLSETGAGRFSTTGTLTVSAVTGILLSGAGANSVGGFSAFNATSGPIRLDNTAATLSVIGITQNATGASTDVTINQTGDLMISGAVSTIAGNNSTLSLTSSGATTINAGISTGGSGTVTLQANQAGTTAGTFDGLTVNALGSITTASGNLSIQAVGGTAGGSGVNINGGADVHVGGTGILGITGTAGGGTGGSGVEIFGTFGGTAVVSSSGGSVTVTGNGHQSYGVLLFQGGQITGATSGNTVLVQGMATTSGIGVYVVSISADVSQISSGGGNVQVVGFGAGTWQGVVVNGSGGPNTALITTSGGNSVSVTGYGGGIGANGSGVEVSQYGAITSSGGPVFVQGVGSTSAYGISIGGAGLPAYVTNPGGGSISLTADSLNIASGASVSAGTGPVTIVDNATGTPINLGGADVLSGTPTLGLSAAELSAITAGMLYIGSSTSGAITVSAAINRSSPTDMILQSGVGGDLSFVGSGVINSAGGSVQLWTSGTHAITSTTGAIDVIAGAGSVFLTAGTGGIGASGNPLIVSGTLLSSTSGGSSSQFLFVAGSITIGPGGLNPGGGGTLELDGGTFTLGGSNRINDAASLNVNGGTFSLGTFSETVDTVTLTSGSITGSTGVLTSTNTIQTQGGTISAILAGGNGLTQTTTGSTTLAGANTYTGTTTINGGALLVNGSLAGPVLVSAAGTLGGSGSVGSVTNQGTVSPGNSPGILTINGNYVQTGTLLEQVQGTNPVTPDFDRLIITGNVTLGGTLNPVLLAGYLPSLGNSYQILDNNGASPISGTFAGLAQGARFVFDRRFFTISYTGGDGNDVVISASGLAVTNTNDAGAGSLRQAILYANSSTGAEEVDFGIAGAGVQTISPLSGLPAITHPVTIDGSSQPGYIGSPLIRLDGTSAGAVPGLWFSTGSDGSTVQDLVIGHFGGSAGTGILLNSNNNRIQGNLIGTDATGTVSAANTNGVSITGTGNTIGGVTANLPNTIAYNTADGVQVISGTGNAIRGNAIFGNGGLGIELGTSGVPSQNVLGGAGAGPNLSQNYPVLTSVTYSAANGTRITGDLNTAPGTTVYVDLYSNPGVILPAYGQGQIYLGTVVVTTGVSGGAQFTFNAPALGLGSIISATATDAAGNTSEFSFDLAEDNPPSATMIARIGATPGTSFNVGQPITFDATGSISPDSYPLTYSWDYGDHTTGIGLTSSHAYAYDGTYVVTLTVNDGHGGIESTTRALTINRVPLLLTLSALPASIAAGTPLLVSGTVTDAAFNPVTIALNWGDGSAPTTLNLAAGVTTFSASHTYLSVLPGGLPAAITVSAVDAPNPAAMPPTAPLVPLTTSTPFDAGGSTGQLVTSINVVAPPISVSGLTQTATSIHENDSISLTGSIVDPYPQASHIVTIDWGDGAGSVSTVALNPGVFSFSGTHRYLNNPTGVAAGSYPIVVTVTNDHGQAATLSRSVTVANVTPSIAIQALAPPDASSLVPLQAVVTDPGTLDPHTYQWSVNGIAVAGANQPVFLFNPKDFATSTGGTYVVSASVGDDVGATSQVTASLLIGPSTPGHTIVLLGAGGGQVTVTVDAQPVGTFTPGNFVVFYTASTGNRVTIDPSLTQPAALVSTPGGSNTLVAGSGDDTLVSARGKDTLIGTTGPTTFVLVLTGDDPVLQGSTGLNTIDLSQTPQDVTLDLGLTTPQVVDSGGDVIQLASGTFQKAIAGSGNVTLYAANGVASTLIGGTGNARLFAGTTGNSTIIGGSGNATVVGGGGNSIIYGTTAGTTSVVGGSGNATVVGGGGNSIIYGTTAGTTSVVGGSGNATVIGGGGNSIIYGSTSGTTSVVGGAGNATVIGGGGNSITYGSTAGTTSVVGGSGSATVVGGGGNSIIYGSTSGTTSVVGGSGNATVVGGGGNSITYGSTSGTTSVVGGAGNATVIGGGGNSIIYGSTSGTTSVVGGAGNATVVGGGGNSIIYGSTSGTTSVVGGSGNATVVGGGGNSIIYGSTSGTTSVVGGSGNATVVGGGGNSITYGSTSGTTSVVGGSGNTTVVGGGGNSIIYGSTSGRTSVVGGAGNATVVGGGGNSIIYGSTTGTSSLVGGSGNATIVGGGGTSIIYGGTGNDSLVAGSGPATLRGGGGSDIIRGNAASWLIEQVPSNNGTTQTATLTDTSLVVPGHQSETIDGVGHVVISLGNGQFLLDASQTTRGVKLIGGAGASTILAGSGADSLVAGSGADSLVGGAGHDSYYFGPDASGTVTIDDVSDSGETLDFSQFSAGITLDLEKTTPQAVAPGVLTLTITNPSAVTRVVGTAYADRILGNGEGDTLIGNGGADYLDGRGGGATVQGAATQVVYLNFRPGAVDYTSQTVRDAIQARIAAIYGAFSFVFTQSVPQGGTYAEIDFNVPAGTYLGGEATALDWRNLDLTGSATVDISKFLQFPGLVGVAGLPAATTQNIINMSATIAAHELGHLSGLLHEDAFGAIGSGVSLTLLADPNLDGFYPGYGGPSGATETAYHVMGSPASVGTSLYDATRVTFFGEREAVKLAFADSGTTVVEASGANNSVPTAQALTLTPVAVPNTLLVGQNVGKAFQVAAVDVNAAITLADDGTSHVDYYSFTATAGQLFNFSVFSQTLTRNGTQVIDPVLTILEADGHTIVPYGSFANGTFVPFASGAVASNDDSFQDPDSVLYDVTMPYTGTYYIQVKNYVPVNEFNIALNSAVGRYELFAYSFAASGAGSGLSALEELIPGSDPGSMSGDTLIGGSGIDTLIGSSANDLMAVAPGDKVVAGSGAATIAPLPSALSVQAVAGGFSGSFIAANASLSYSVVWHVTTSNGQSIADTSQSFDAGELSSTAATPLSYSLPTSAPGVYAVTLTVTDGLGLSRSARTTRTIGTPLVVGISLGNSPVVGPILDTIGTPITLTATGATTYAWTATLDGANGPEATGSSPSFVFTPGASGTYTISLAATDAFGQQSVSVVTVLVAAPSVQILGVPANGYVAEGSSFSLSSLTKNAPAGSSLAWTIAVGAGTAGPAVGGSSFTYTLQDVGSYNVTLRLLDANGHAIAAASQQIIGIGVAPTAVLSGGPTGSSSPEGTALTFQGTASSATAAATALGYYYKWTATRGGVTYASTSTGTLSTSPSSFAFTPGQAGTYVIHLSAVDSRGFEGLEVTRSVDVTAVPPTVAITGLPANATAVVGSTLSLGASVTAATGPLQGAGFFNTWTVAYAGMTYGPYYGSGLNLTTNGVGLYAITLSSEDAEGVSGQTTAVVNVVDVAPVVSPTAGSLAATQGRISTFALGSVAGPGLALGQGTLLVNWGDSTFSSYPISSAGTLPLASHAYSLAGSYTVSVGVTDVYGMQGSATLTAVVSGIAPVPSILGVPSSWAAGVPVTLGSSVSVASQAEAAFGLSYSWTVTKDGAAYAIPGNPVTNLSSFTFQPTVAGAYVITLSATGHNGLVGHASTSFTINQTVSVVSVTATSASYSGSAYGGSPVTTVNGTATTQGVAYSYYLQGSTTPIAAPVHVGSYTVKASYAGSGLYTPGSASANYAINPASTSVTGSSSGVAFGGSSLIATITSAAGIPTGSVSFYDSTTMTALGSAPVDATGKATITPSIPLGAGVHSILLTFTSTSGDFNGSSASFAVNSQASIYVLNATASAAISVSGSSVVTVPGTIQVASSSSTSVVLSGASRLNAASIGVYGGTSVSGSSGFSVTPTRLTSRPADPLAGLPVPSATGLATKAAVNVAANSVVTISPGIYPSITVAGSGKLTMQAGTYVITGGGFSVSGAGSVTGSGVFIYNAGSNYNGGSGSTFGSFALGGSGTINLTPPTSGTYAGVSIFQSRDNTRPMSLSGAAAAQLGGGTIYAPAAALSLSGSTQVGGTGAASSSLIVSTLTLTGATGAYQLASGSAPSMTVSTFNWITAPVLTLAAVDDTGAGLDPAKLADLGAAMSYVNQALAAFGVNLSWAGDATTADVMLHFATTTPAGGADDGVIGYTTAQNDVYFVDGWNYATSLDPAQTGPDQFDFMTLAIHELGHVLGLGESDDPGSVMYEYLSPGTVRREFTTSNLTRINTDADRFMKVAAAPSAHQRVSLSSTPRLAWDPGIVTSSAAPSAIPGAKGLGKSAATRPRVAIPSSRSGRAILQGTIRVDMGPSAGISSDDSSRAALIDLAIDQASVAGGLLPRVAKRPGRG